MGKHEIEKITAFKRFNKTLSVVDIFSSHKSKKCDINI